MNKLLGKNHRIRTYEINKMYWSCFDDKTFILDKAKKIVCLRLPDRPCQKLPTLTFFSQESAKNYRRPF